MNDYNPLLITDRLTLRKLSLYDKYDVFRYASDHRLDKYVHWFIHVSIDDTMCYLYSAINKYNKHEPSDWGIMYNQTKQVIGTIGLDNYSQKNIEINYALSVNNWNNGIMTEALLKIVEFCFSELGVNKIKANCFSHNFASARVLKKCGFFIDGYYMHKNLRYRKIKIFSIKNEKWKTKLDYQS